MSAFSNSNSFMMVGPDNTITYTLCHKRNTKSELLKSPAEAKLACVTDLEVAGVPELATAVLAGEAALVVVDEHVVVEAVLACERGVTDQAHKRLDACRKPNIEK